MSEEEKPIIKEENLNLSDDPTQITLDPYRVYSSHEMKKIFNDRANALYKLNKDKLRIEV